MMAKKNGAFRKSLMHCCKDLLSFFTLNQEGLCQSLGLMCLTAILFNHLQKPDNDDGCGDEKRELTLSSCWSSSKDLLLKLLQMTIYQSAQKK